MLPIKFKTILFDLDGTLLDTCEGIVSGIRYSLQKKGFPPLDFETMQKRFIGPPLRQAFIAHCGMSESEAEDAIGIYREYYASTGVHQCKPYEGIRELLEHLRDEGQNLYVATAKPTDYSKIILDSHDLSKYFIKIFGASFDKSLDTKEKIIAALLKSEGIRNAIMVGDTHHDINGARKNSISSVGVLYGFGDRELVFNAKPDFIAETVNDLYDILSSPTPSSNSH